jgi:pyruvate kinase
MSISKNYFAKRRTKIVCTIGPSTNSELMLERLVNVGMNCARLNFSHGKPSEHLQVIESIRRISKRTGKQIAVLQDLPGPKFRIAKVKNGSVNIKKGSLLTLTTKHVEGNAELIPLRSQNLPRYVRKGGTIFLSDGSIKLKVLRVTRDVIQCKCELGGVLLSGKGVNVPMLKDGLETFTQKDKEFLGFGLEHDVDLVAVSFVRKASDIEAVKNFVEKKGSEVQVIAKIEKREAVDNIGSIIAASDALMVARGDLGVENPIEEIPELQKEIISDCNSRSIPVITATQMLESMVNNPSPTRAEVTDVANSIFDGTDAVMLSEETAIGKYPIECVKTLDKVALRAEDRMMRIKKSVSTNSPENITEAISAAAAQISTVIGAKVIIAPLDSNDIVPKISRFRPNAPILAISDTYATLRRSLIVWGVFPILPDKKEALDRTLVATTERLLHEKLLKSGERVMLVHDSQVSSGLKSINLRAMEFGRPEKT